MHPMFHSVFPLLVDVLFPAPLAVDVEDLGTPSASFSFAAPSIPWWRWIARVIGVALFSCRSSCSRSDLAPTKGVGMTCGA